MAEDIKKRRNDFLNRRYGDCPFCHYPSAPKVYFGACVVECSQRCYPSEERLGMSNTPEEAIERWENIKGAK